MKRDAESISQIKSLYDAMPYQDDNSDFSVLLKSLPEEIDTQKMNLLEVGCGAGHISNSLSRFFASVTGIDLSAKSIERAKTRFSKNPKVSFHQANLFDPVFLEKNSNKYDFVLCYGVLHHTPDPRKGYANLCRLVKKGGFLLTGVYSRTMLGYRAKRKAVLLLSKDQSDRYEVANKLLFGGKGHPIPIFDGYVNPQVSFHSIKEVLNWVSENKMEYMGSFPYFEIFAYPALLRQKLSGHSISRRKKARHSSLYLCFSAPLTELL